MTDQTSTTTQDPAAAWQLDPVVRDHLEIGPAIDWQALGMTAGRSELLRQLDRNFARWGRHYEPVAAEFEEWTAGGTVDLPEIGRRATHAPVRLRVFHPAPGTASGVHVLLHGGGWRSGSIDEQCTVHAARRIAAEAGVAVVAIDYRLAPEHPWPAALVDVLDSVDHLQQAANALDLDLSALSLGGVSAGANLAAAAVLAGLPVPVRGLVLEVPALDLTCGTMLRADPALSSADQQEVLVDYLPDPALRAHPLVSPLLADDLSCFPPTTVLSAGLDPLRHDASAVVARLRAAGVPVRHLETPGALHGSSLLTGAWPPAARWQDAMVAAVQAAHTAAGRS